MHFNNLVAILIISTTLQIVCVKTELYIMIILILKYDFMVIIEQNKIYGKP